MTSHERVPVYVQCEPKDKSKLVKEPVAKIVRLEAHKLEVSWHAKLKFDCATPGPSETAVHFHEREAPV